MTRRLFSTYIPEIFEIKCLQIVYDKPIVLCPLENNTKRIQFIEMKRTHWLLARHTWLIFIIFKNIFSSRWRIQNYVGWSGGCFKVSEYHQ